MFAGLEVELRGSVDLDAGRIFDGTAVENASERLVGIGERGIGGRGKRVEQTGGELDVGDGEFLLGVREEGGEEEKNERADHPDFEMGENFEWDRGFGEILRGELEFGEPSLHLAF